MKKTLSLILLVWSFIAHAEQGRPTVSAPYVANSFQEWTYRVEDVSGEGRMSLPTFIGLKQSCAEEHRDGQTLLTKIDIGQYEPGKAYHQITVVSNYLLGSIGTKTVQVEDTLSHKKGPPVVSVITNLDVLPVMANGDLRVMYTNLSKEVRCTLTLTNHSRVFIDYQGGEEGTIYWYKIGFTAKVGGLSPTNTINSTVAKIRNLIKEEVFIGGSIVTSEANNNFFALIPLKSRKGPSSQDITPLASGVGYTLYSVNSVEFDHASKEVVIK